MGGGWIDHQVGKECQKNIKDKRTKKKRVWMNQSLTARVFSRSSLLMRVLIWIAKNLHFPKWRHFFLLFDSVFLHTHKKNVSTFISFLVIWEQFCLEHRLFYILYCKMAAAGYGVVVFLLYSGNYLTFLFIFSSTLGRILLPYFQKIKRGKYIGRLGPKKKD